MNHTASRIEAALTIITEARSKILTMPVKTPAAVYERRHLAYELENAEKFIRDAYITSMNLHLHNKEAPDDSHE